MQLLGEGLELEEFGGDVQCVQTAAKARLGLRELEEALLLQVGGWVRGVGKWATSGTEHASDCLIVCAHTLWVCVEGCTPHNML